MGFEGLTTTVGTGAANPIGPNDSNTIQSLLENIDTFDALLHPGDLAYADTAVKEAFAGFLGMNLSVVEPDRNQIAAVYESFLEQYYDQLTPLTAYKPYMVAPGNHEANCDNGGTTDKVHNITYTEASCVVGQTNFTGFSSESSPPSLCS